MLTHPIVFAILITLASSSPLNFEDDDLWNNNDESQHFDKLHGKQFLDNSTAPSLSQFSVFDSIGRGSFASVYVARKNGGSDNGKLYAMKVVNITKILLVSQDENQLKMMNFLVAEREILEKIRDLTCVTRLHYAFRVGTFLFLVMDLATSENVDTRLDNMKHNGRSNVSRTTARRILAETLVAVEKLHALNISHGDLSPRNMVVDAEGHLLLADFGYSTELNGDDGSRLNWRDLAEICDIYFFRIRDEPLISLSNMLRNATDSQVHELKQHPWFDEIEWQKVADRTFDAPFKPETEFTMNFERQLDLVDLLEIDSNGDLDERFVDMFCNYSYVAPEHRI